MFNGPDDVKQNLLKRGSFVAVFLKNIPLLLQFHLTTVLGFFKKCLIWDMALFLKHSTIYYWEVSGSNILGASLSYTTHGKTEKKAISRTI